MFGEDSGCDFLENHGNEFPIKPPLVDLKTKNCEGFSDLEMGKDDLI